MAVANCPGSSLLRTPELKLKECPQCGHEIEIFTNELSTSCTGCGFVIYQDTISCVLWCQFAEECIDPEIVKEIREKHAKK